MGPALDRAILKEPARHNKRHNWEPWTAIDDHMTNMTQTKLGNWRSSVTAVFWAISANRKITFKVIPLK